MNNHYTNRTKKLTFKQREIYHYILDFKSVNGLSPTISEIAKGTYTSRSYARNCVHELSRKGYIKYDETKRRSIVVLVFDQTA